MLAPLPLAGRSAGNAPLFCLTSLPAGAQGELLLLLPLLSLLLLYGQHLHVLLLCDSCHCALQRIQVYKFKFDLQPGSLTDQVAG